MSQDAFLARIRGSLSGGSSGVGARRATAEARLRRPPEHPRPALAKQDAEVCIRLLVKRLLDSGSEVEELSGLDQASAAIVGLLAKHGFPPLVALAPDPRLEMLNWEGAGLAVDRGPVTACRVAVSHAEAAVAETGTLVLASGAESPSLLAFLPDLHVVAVSRATVVTCYEEALVRLCRLGDTTLPRAINLVSGPSRTGDIGGRIVLGAHGPRQLAVFVYG